jgi:hypothetical protein
VSARRRVMNGTLKVSALLEQYRPRLNPDRAARFYQLPSWPETYGPYGLPPLWAPFPGQPCLLTVRRCTQPCPTRQVRNHARLKQLRDSRLQPTVRFYSLSFSCDDETTLRAKEDDALNRPGRFLSRIASIAARRLIGLAAAAYQTNALPELATLITPPSLRCRRIPRRLKSRQITKLLLIANRSARRPSATWAERCRVCRITCARSAPASPAAVASPARREFCPEKRSPPSSPASWASTHLETRSPCRTAGQRWGGRPCSARRTAAALHPRRRRKRPQAHPGLPRCQRAAGGLGRVGPDRDQLAGAVRIGLGAAYADLQPLPWHGDRVAQRLAAEVLATGGVGAPGAAGARIA